MNFTLAITIIILCLAVTNDVRFRRIPNWLTFPAMSAALTYHLCTSGISGFGTSITGLIIGGSIFFVFYIMGGMGAGDIKLMAAIGALFGPKDILYIALFTAIAGGIYAVALLLATRKKQAIMQCAVIARNFLSTGFLAFKDGGAQEKRASLRYGIAIAAGTIAVLIKNNMIHF